MQAFNNETFETDLSDPAEDLRNTRKINGLPEELYAPVALLGKGKRNKRTEAEMIAAQGSPLAQASYITGRLAKLEEKMAELLAAASPEARDLIVAQAAHSHLRRYLP